MFPHRLPRRLRFSPVSTADFDCAHRLMDQQSSAPTSTQTSGPGLKPPPPRPGDDNYLSPGALAAILTSVLLAAGLAVAGLVIWRRRRRVQPIIPTTRELIDPPSHYGIELLKSPVAPPAPIAIAVRQSSATLIRQPASPPSPSTSEIQPRPSPSPTEITPIAPPPHEGSIVAVASPPPYSPTDPSSVRQVRASLTATDGLIALHDALMITLCT